MATLGQIIFYSMVTLIIIFAALIILILVVTFSGGIPFQVRSTRKNPVGNLGKDELLSCYLGTDREQINDMSVTWSKTGSSRIVHKYSDGVDELSDQDSSYTGRTRLFQDSLAQGNASLLLKSLRRTDEGEYKCAIQSSAGSGDVTVRLRAAAYSAPTFTFTGGVLKAEAARWSPKPEVTWKDLDEEVLEAETVMTGSSEGIFSLTSSLKEAQSGTTYFCHIKHELVTSVSQATPTGTGVVADSNFAFSSATSLLASYLSITSALLCLSYVT